MVRLDFPWIFTTQSLDFVSRYQAKWKDWCATLPWACETLWCTGENSPTTSIPAIEQEFSAKIIFILEAEDVSMCFTCLNVFRMNEKIKTFWHLFQWWIAKSCHCSCFSHSNHQDIPGKRNPQLVSWKGTIWGPNPSACYGNGVKTYCWWFRNPKQPPFGCIKPCK